MQKKEFTEEIYTKREFIALMNYYYMRLLCTLTTELSVIVGILKIK
jgi:hypothetical protein